MYKYKDNFEMLQNRILKFGYTYAPYRPGNTKSKPWMQKKTVGLLEVLTIDEKLSFHNIMLIWTITTVF